MLCGVLKRHGTKVVAPGANVQLAYDFDSENTQNLEVARINDTKAIVCWTCHQLAEGSSDPQFLCASLEINGNKTSVAHGPLAMDQEKILKHFHGPFSNEPMKGREDPLNVQLQEMTNQKAMFCWGNRAGDRYRCTYVHYDSLKFEKSCALLQHGFGAGFFYGVGFRITTSEAQLRPLDAATSMLCALYNKTTLHFQVGCSLLTHNLNGSSLPQFGPRWLAGKEDASNTSFTFGNFGARRGFVCYRKRNGNGGCQGWRRIS